MLCFFFFKQKTAYEIYQCDWSSDVCSSDLLPEEIEGVFEECRRRPYVVMESGRVLRDYTIFQCYGFKGMERKSPGRF